MLILDNAEKCRKTDMAFIYDFFFNSAAWNILSLMKTEDLTNYYSL